TISDNNSGLGGGIYNQAGTLNVTGSTVAGNTASNSSGNANGGGIFIVVGSTATITNSAIVSNTASSSGVSGSSSGGGISGSATITNSTISGNQALAFPTGAGSATGGGISGGGTLTNVTIANNFANSNGIAIGGGINVVSPTTIIRNSIVANNTATINPDISGAFTSQGNNLVRNRSGSSGYIASDLPDGTDPLLDVLKNNGGLSATHALLAGSPAIDAGNNSFATGANDQRGPGFARIFGSAVDIGAFEVQGATAALVSIDGRVKTASGQGVSKAQVWITNMEGARCFTPTNSFGFYRFEGIPAGETYVFDVHHKRYSFVSQVLSVNEETNGLNFTAFP
ncbi:MAG: carboxypeptidase-like regulatory domain-containing protein, partial [Acidobacteriota bacterium]|nr:carboxypeptidase-like regulatory domain-containing protein [Acidobacteriota bacterium]